jgi:hypothetical protein
MTIYLITIFYFGYLDKPRFEEQPMFSQSHCEEQAVAKATKERNFPRFKFKNISIMCIDKTNLIRFPE